MLNFLRMSTQERVMRYARSRRRMPMLNVDLNAEPPCESRNQEGTSTRARSQDGQAGQQVDTVPAPIDLEAYEDDVIISSPGAFAEAKNNSIRNRGRTVVVDLDAEERSSRNKRRRVSANQTIINCDVYVNLDGNNNAMFIPFFGRFRCWYDNPRWTNGCFVHFRKTRHRVWCLHCQFRHPKRSLNSAVQFAWAH
ncbi:uncharacterized protein LOC111403626 isoform X3 [Olea europaea var. sylvestris]|uniref:uncharacterized protein LOC111403626 isoform X3 n=1 Tax=Olea europaea var. sylvestris TaxID=158386 RepID=UPI000C1D5A2C|nr:uncharacterized protein LOC111403626 isoform X3 [Olea europaea var. sylvestris]